MIDLLTADGLGDLIKSAREGIGFLRDASDTARSVRDTIDELGAEPVSDGRIRVEVSEVLDKLIRAQIGQSEILDRLQQLEAALKNADRSEKEFARYTLTETKAGGLVYALKPNDEMDEPHHYLCAHCVGNNKKSILQPATETSMHCRNCKTYTWMKHPEPKPLVERYRRQTWMDR